MNIYIDFDRTLFNTDKFLIDLYNVIINSKIDLYEFKKNKLKEKKNGFNPYNVLEKIHVNSDIYQKIDELISNCDNYLYSDSEEFLKRLKEKNYNIILLTKGNSDFQIRKVKSTRVYSYFDDVIVTLKKKGKLNLDYQNSIFIDDNPSEIESIMKRNPKRMIRIMRENAKYNDVVIKESVDVIHNLLDYFNED